MIRRSPTGVGVTDAVYLNDQLNRLERIVDILNNSVLTLEELERYERAIVKAHSANLVRLPDYAEVTEG